MSDTEVKEITRPAEAKKSPVKMVLWILFLIILGTLVGFAIANTPLKSNEDETQTETEVSADVQDEVQLSEEEQQNNVMVVMVLAGALIIIIAVVVTVVSSTVSSVASAVDDEEDE